MSEQGQQLMPIFSVHVQKVLEDVPRYDYLLFRYSQGVEGVSRDVRDYLIQTNTEFSLKFCPEEHIPKKTVEMESAEKCFTHLLEKHSPLMEGESVKEDFFTYLLEPALDNQVEKHTLLLIRATNKAVLIYFIHSAQVLLPTERDIPTRLTMLSASQRRVNSVPAEEWLATRERLQGGGRMVRAGLGPMLGGFEPTVVRSAAAKIVKNLLEYALKKLVSTLAMTFLGPLGSLGVDLIFDLFLPVESKPDHEFVKKIVKEEISMADLTHIDSAISSIMNALQYEYTPRRKLKDDLEKDDREDLMALLQKYDAAFLSGPGGMLGMLEQENFKKIGLGLYILGMSLRISIFQECATVDPSVKSDGSFHSPLESSYGRPVDGTVAQTAKHAAAHVSSMWPLVRTDRTNSITIVEYHQGRMYGLQHAVIANVPMAKIHDSATDESFEEQVVDTDKYGRFIIPDAMKDSLKRRRQEAVNDLASRLGDPDEALAVWKQLISKPLNM